MAPEVIACDENPDATYDYRVRLTLETGALQKETHSKTVGFFVLLLTVL